MPRFAFLLPALAIFLTPSHIHAAQEPLEARVQRLLKALDHDAFAQREAAEKEILALPVEAIPLLQQSLLAPQASPEIKARLPKALEALRSKFAPVLQKQRLDARLAWYRRNLVEAYDKVGKRAPKWNVPAREALELTAKVFGRDPGRDFNEEPRILALCGKAIQAGCDDPLIAYVRIRMNDIVHGTEPEELIQQYQKTAGALEKSDYPRVVWNTICFNRVAQALLGVEVEPESREGRDNIFKFVLQLNAAQLKDFLAEDGMSAPVLDEILSTTCVLDQAVGSKDMKVCIDSLSEALEKAKPGTAWSHAFKGSAYIAYAWMARGGGTADTVREEGWKLMKERLAVAEHELTEAWRIDPANPVIAKSMISIVLGTTGDRNAMDLWFRRAVEADPTYLEVYEAKLNFLEPKWHGSKEDLLAFGRECLTSPQPGVPQYLAKAQHRLALYTTPDHRLDVAYLKRPEVWKDIQEAYEAALKAKPKDALARSHYANYACLAGNWDVAQAQFALLGEDAWTAVFGGRQRYGQMKAKAAKGGK